MAFVVLVAIGCGGAPPVEQILPGLTVERILPGYWLHTSEGNPGAFANGLLVEQDGCLLLVDTPWTDEKTAGLLEWAGSRFSSPVCSAILTHSHADRSGGLGALGRAGIPTRALDRTVERVQKEGRGSPEVLFTAAERFHEDPNGVEYLYPGPAHAPDNIVVWFTENRVLFGGCLVLPEASDDLGYLGDADLTGWRRAVDAVRDRFPEAALVIPGHGPPGDRGLLDHTRDLLSAAPVPLAAVLRAMDLSRHFEPLGATGAFVLHHGEAGVQVVHDPELAAGRHPPASTFKIPHALIALETGVVTDEHETIPWDGMDRGGAGWNRDHDLDSAFRASAVWYFQELAYRIGRERMDRWLDRIDYGNRSTEGPIDQFWLYGGLRISPLEQVAFLRRLHAGTLPFSEENQAAVRRMMEHELPGGRQIAGKTGWTTLDGVHHGWYVGWTGAPTQPAFFALYVTSNAPDFNMRTAQRSILAALLKETEQVLQPRAAPPE